MQNLSNFNPRVVIKATPPPPLSNCQENPSIKWAEENMNHFSSKVVCRNIVSCDGRDENLIRQKTGFFKNSILHSDGIRQGALADLRKFLLQCLTFVGSIGILKFQLPFRYLALSCLALTMMLFGGIIETKAVTLDYHWQLAGKPKQTVMYVRRDTPASEYPYLKGRLTELSGVGADRYYELRVIHRSPGSGEWWTTDRDDINTTSKWPNEGSAHVTCNGESIFGRKRELYYGTFYYQTRTLNPSFHGSFHFWFCPNKTNLDKLGTSTNTYYTAKLEIKYRYKSGSSWKTKITNSDMSVTVFRTENNKPDLKWNGGDGFLKRIVADGSQSYDDLFGYTVNNSKPENSDRISAVQEKWLANGSSVGSVIASVEDPREEVGSNDWSGLERPLGDALQYGTWYFSNNYQRFMFRPDAEAVNRLLPGERVRSHVTYSWKLPICHTCPSGLIGADTARVEIVREGASLSWDDNQEWSDNEIGKLRYAESNLIESVLGRASIRLAHGSMFSVSASDTTATENNGMPEELLSATSDESDFSTEYVSKYGKWLWRENNSGFKFEPDWVAINLLGTGNSATTTLNLKVSNAGQELYKSSVSVTVHGTTATVHINDVTLAEGNGGGSADFQFTVRLSPSTALNQTFAVPVEFNHWTTDSSDLVGSTPTGLINSGMLDLNFGAMETEQTITIQVNSDDLQEHDETFRLVLQEPTGNAKFLNLIQLNSNLESSVGLGTIVDDDRAVLSIDDISLDEGDGSGNTEFEFTVSLSPATALNQSFKVPITFAHATTDSADFVSDPTLTTFEADFDVTAISKSISVMVKKDDLGEEREHFTLTLSEPTGAAADMDMVRLSADSNATVGTGTINNDDAKKLYSFWSDGFDGEIVSNGLINDYGYQVGEIGNTLPFAASIYLSEVKNGTTVNYVSNAVWWESHLDLTQYSEFIGSNSEHVKLNAANAYGDWYAHDLPGCGGNGCRKSMLFVPKVGAINQLEDGDVVTSTLIRRTWHQGFEESVLRVTIRADYVTDLVGFDHGSRTIAVSESEAAVLSVAIPQPMTIPVTIPFEIAGEGTAKLNHDFNSPASASVTIPAGQTQGTITVPTIDDSSHEDSEYYKVLLRDGAEFEITPLLQSATVTIIDDDPPEIPMSGSSACVVDTKPTSVATPNTEVYWKVGVPEEDGNPIVYREADDSFDVQLGFRNHGTKVESTPNSNNTFYFGTYYLDGTLENPGIPNFALSSSNHVVSRISQPGSFRGYLRYRILPRNIADNSWYYVGGPCEFYIWWTDANRPGITMSIEQVTISEGKSFKVIATAIPAPNRDILVPFTLSDESRIEDSQVYNVLIKSGQTSGHVDIHTKFIADDQTADEVVVTAEWTHAYWLDDTKKTASVTIVDHVKKVVEFRSSDVEISVEESGVAELVVELASTHTADVTVEFQIDDVSATESEDYTAPNPSRVIIPTGSREEKISIPIISDTGNEEIEESETFTVTLIESGDNLIRDRNSVATVTILDNDPPEIPTRQGTACAVDTKPAAVATPNTEAYWRSGAPKVNGKPVVYREAGDRFDVEIGFRDHTTKAVSTPNVNATFYFAIYNLNGTVKNAGLANTAKNTSVGVNRTISEPLDFRGYLSYRIESNDAMNNTWYYIGDPCEFHIWWTDAVRPGVALSVDETSVSEGSTFRVTATATPAPNRDILVPISFSDTTRFVGSPSQSIRIKSGQTSGHIEIQTKYAPGDQTVDDVTVTAEWRSSHWLDESVKSAAISISESTLPVLSVSSGGSITEADNAVAMFNVSSEISIGNREVEVNYTVTETGNFLLPPDPGNPSFNGHTSNTAVNATMTFTDRSESGDGSGPFIHKLEIPLRNNDELDSGTPSVTVTLNPDTDGTDYVLSTGTSASVTIIDDETLPVLSFEASNNIVEFDEPNSTDTVKHITFKVTATAPTNPETLSNVRYTPSQSGNFIDKANGNTPDTPTQTTLNFSESGGTFTASLEIPIAADENLENTGSVTVTLLKAEGTAFHYKLSADAESHSWTVTVYDNDIPELRIDAPVLQFLEGSNGSVDFTVTARFNVSGSISVNFNVEEFSTADFDTPLSPHTFVDTSLSSPLDLEFNGGRSAPLSVPITNDSVSEPNRVVRISLVARNSTEYTVASMDSGGRAELTVSDDDGVPMITISAPESVSESDGTIEYTISTQRNPGSALNVNFTLAEGDGDDYLSAGEEARTSANIVLEDADSNGTFSGAFTVNLTNDNSGEPTGLVTLTLTENSGSYRLVAATKTATVKVYDDDVPEIHFANDAGGDSIVEANGANAIFKVTASFLPSSPLTIHYTPTSASFLADGTSGVKVTANLSFADESTNGEGPFTANLAVPVDNDDKVEGHGSITVTLNTDEPANETYTVDMANNEAMVTVRDDESLTMLTIGGPESVLESAGTAVFIVTAHAPISPGNSYDVVYAVTQNGDFLSSRYSASSDGLQTEGLNFAASGGVFKADLTIDLDNDNTGEDTGSVTVRLEINTSTTSDYVLGSKKEHTVIVNDDDAPLIWIETVEDYVELEAGAMASFMLHSHSPVSVEISYMVEESSFIDASNIGIGTTTGNFDDPAGSHQDYTKQINIPLLNTGTGEDAFAEVTVTLQNAEVGSNPKYRVVPNNPERPDAATVHVFNVSTGTPFANVGSDRDSVTEGENIVFKIRIIPVQEHDMRVRLKMSQQGGYVPWPVPDSVMVPPSGAMLKIPTVDSEKVDSGMVTVEVVNGQGYQPGTSKSVTITDNGTPVPKYSVAANVIQAILLQSVSEDTQGEPVSSGTEISIRSVVGIVAEGEQAEFVIAGSDTIAKRTRVSIALEQRGDFIIGPMLRSVELEEGDSEKVLLVATADDGLAEADGRITATIREDNGYLVGSESTAHVVVSDDLDRQRRKNGVSNALHAVLPDLLAHSTTRTLDIATERVVHAFSGSPETSIELNGKSPAMVMLQSGGEMLNGSDTDWRSIIDDSSFTLALYPEGGEKNLATVWGVGNRWSLSGDGIGEQQSWDGETHTGHFGFDAQVGHGILAGLAMSVSQSEIDYGRIGESEMSLDTMATAAHPYLGFYSTDGNSQLQVMAGFGENELELKQEEYLPEFLNVRFHTVGLSGSNRLFSNGNFGGLHNFELNVSGEAWHSRQFVNQVEGVVDNLQVEARHIRIAIEGAHDFNLATSGKISPSISIGLQEEGRNDKSFSGLDAGSVVEYQVYDGFEIVGSGKVMSFGLNRVHKWNIEGSVDYDSGNDGKGILISMSQSWSSSDTDDKWYDWATELPGVSNNSSTSPVGARLAAEIGYGFEVLDSSSVLTPFHSFRHSIGGDWEFQLGNRIATNSGIDVEFVAVRESSGSNTVEHGINLNGNIRW